MCGILGLYGEKKMITTTTGTADNSYIDIPSLQKELLCTICGIKIFSTIGATGAGGEYVPIDSWKNDIGESYIIIEISKNTPQILILFILFHEIAHYKQDRAEFIHLNQYCGGNKYTSRIESSANKYAERRLLSIGISKKVIDSACKAVGWILQKNYTIKTFLVCQE